jgi:lipid-binding SYLF domain-containing protein
MDSQTNFSRRGFVAAAAGSLAVAGCSNPVGSGGGARIDQRVDSARNYLLSSYPMTAELEATASGVLYMPLVTKAGFGVGGSYGSGALRIGNATVDYYEVVAANFGFQAGAEQYSHALFFMTPEALEGFRTSHGWSLGANVSYTVVDQGSGINADTMVTLEPIVALVYAQGGLIAGATLEGEKYRRFIP